ncbi:TraR/DksA C4-type zinc finger protein [Pseudomonas sp.]|uniref:TraR/DksA C4-type zinc finger protein n=1 Tax=Pseudomonas sp. TaxID=306 RepID=UPI0032630194
MSKAFDFASDLEESIRAAAIAQRTVYTGISAKECECGEEIPEGRRLAIPGVKLCVGCADRVALVKGGVRRG